MQTASRPAVSFDSYVLQLIERTTGIRPWVLEEAAERWRNSRNDEQSLLDFFIENGALDRISARAIWLAWTGNLDERETRQLINPTVVAEVLRKLTGPRPVEAPRHILPVGARLGRYRIKGLLGWGGYGAVYLSTHPTLGIPVAIKTVPTTGLARDLFRREARLQATIHHPTVVRVWDFEDEDEIACLVLEYVAGESLRDRLDDGPLSLEIAFRMVAQATLGLRAAHRMGVTHHDVKPANLFGTAEGGYKLGDFGLARCGIPITHITRVDAPPASLPLGTPNYMAPEQFQVGADHRADIYSLGLTLYHALSGVMPVPGDDVQDIMLRHQRGNIPPLAEVAMGLPAGVVEIVRQMTMADPDRRISNYDDLLDGLTEAFGLRLVVI